MYKAGSVAIYKGVCGLVGGVVEVWVLLRPEWVGGPGEKAA